MKTIDFDKYRELIHDLKICSTEGSGCEGCFRASDEISCHRITPDAVEAITNLMEYITEQVTPTAKTKSDSVSHPSHYNQGSIEVWDAVYDWGLNFGRGSAVKYIARAGHKGDELEDLQKARTFIDHEITKLVLRRTAEEFLKQALTGVEVH